MRILVMDDDPVLLALYRSVFENRDKLHVDFAESSAVCRTLLETGTYDVLLLDLHLEEGYEGAEMLFELRRGKGIEKADIFIMSTQDDDMTRALCRRLGATCFVSKNDRFLSRLVRIAQEAERRAA